jgi:hypothetical protein
VGVEVTGLLTAHESSDKTLQETEVAPELATNLNGFPTPNKVAPENHEKVGFETWLALA